MATLLRVSLVAALSTLVTCYNNAKFDIHNGNLTRIQDIDGRCKNPCISEGLRLGIEAIIVGRNLTSKECVCEFFNKTTWDAADKVSNIPDFAIGLTMRTIIMEAQLVKSGGNGTAAQVPMPLRPGMYVETSFKQRRKTADFTNSTITFQDANNVPLLSIAVGSYTKADGFVSLIAPTETLSQNVTSKTGNLQTLKLTIMDINVTLNIDETDFSLNAAPLLLIFKQTESLLFQPITPETDITVMYVKVERN